MTRMTGGQALIKSLYREGVRTIFGMPGIQLAIYDEPGIRFITVRHEQAAAYMAFGYSKAGGDGIGTALVVPGPGLLNATAGVGTAYSASTPTLLVAGQSYTPRDRQGHRRASRGQRPARCGSAHHQVGGPDDVGRGSPGHRP